MRIIPNKQYENKDKKVFKPKIYYNHLSNFLFSKNELITKSQQKRSDISFHYTIERS